MKYVKKILGAGVLFATLMACETTPEYVELESGLKFRKLEEGDTSRAQAGEVMNVVMTHTLNDSILYDSGDEQGYYLNPQTSLPPNLKEAFIQCGVGDSAQIQMSYAEYAAMTGRPIEPGDSSQMVVWNIKVREIEKESVVVERIQAEQMELEQGLIDEYLVNNNLEATKTEEGVAVVTLEEGNGEFPQQGDEVKVNYVVRLLDGTVIDTSYEDVAQENGVFNPQRAYEPYGFTIGAGGVIEGWQIGVPNVDKGGKAKLLVPSRYGYGARNNGGPIPPNSVLVFDIEVVDF